MKTQELVELIKESNPKLIGDIPDKKVARIIAAAFAQLKLQVETNGEGVVRVPALGRFKIRQIEREKDGKKVKVERIGFKVAKPKPVKTEKTA